MSESSSEDENLKLLKESIDPDLTNDKLYKNSGETSIEIPKESLRPSFTNNDFNNPLSLTPGTQKYIATQLDAYLEQLLSKQVVNLPNIAINKRKRKKSRVRLLSNSEHYIEPNVNSEDLITKEFNKRNKSNIKQEFDSEDEKKVKEILVTPNEILSKKEVENWAKSTRTKHIFRYKKLCGGKNIIGMQITDFN